MPFWDVKPSTSPDVRPAEMVTKALVIVELSESLREIFGAIVVAVEFSVYSAVFETETCSFQPVTPRVENVQSGLPVGLFPKPISGVLAP